MYVEDPPPPPPGDTGELETKAITVSRFTFNTTHLNQTYDNGLFVPYRTVRVYEMERITYFMGGPDEFVVHVEYER